eukprot:1154991-Pelagomonas_calceolata.AAC.1
MPSIGGSHWVALSFMHAAERQAPQCFRSAALEGGFNDVTLPMQWGIVGRGYWRGCLEEGKAHAWTDG